MNRMHRLLCRSAAWRAAVRRKILPWTLEGVRLSDDVLEIGPGPGLTTDALRTLVARVTAVEIDRRLAGSLARRLERSNVSVVRGDGAELPFADGAFSSAVSMTMLHHVPTPEAQDRLLREVHRVLAPGGWFVGTDNTPSLLFRLLHVGDTMTLVDPSGLEARLRDAGFVDARVETGRGRFRFRSRKAAG